MSKLVLTGLGKTFGTVPAVQDVSLTLQQGEFVSLLGPSGCGKTTTLRMIAGFISPTAGTIEMNGAPLSAPNRVVAPEKRGMSMIFQSYAIWPNMTVAQNVAFGLKLRRLPGERLAPRLDRILDVVQLGHLKNRYPAELSGGQQQRVALARAIVIEPEVLLLDEPLSNLDANLREEMRSEIRRLHDAFRITTVYVTHDQAEAMVTSDRIVVMNHGRIEQVDDPRVAATTVRGHGSSRGSSARPISSTARRAGTIGFPGFTVRADLAAEVAGDNGRSAFRSVRRISSCIAPRRPMRTVPGGSKGASPRRAYLGEYLGVRGAAGCSRICAFASAPRRRSVYETGDAVWLEIDPRRIARVPSSEV